MRNIWSRLRSSRTRSFARHSAPRWLRLGLEQLECRLTLSTTASLDPGGNLLIEDTGVSGNDNLTIKSDTTNSQLILSDPGTAINTSIAGATGSGTGTVTIPFGSVPGSAILVNTFAGDDFLTVDLSLGNFAKPINYAGGDQGPGGDELTLQGGGTFANVTHTFISASAGSVAVTGNALISYSGLEPVTDNLSATRPRFTFTGGTETITLFAPVGTPFDLAIDSTLGEIVLFTNPTNSLTIDAGTGDDTVNINGVRPTFAASLIINGGVGHDMVNLNNDITFAANRNLDVDLQNDDAESGHGPDRRGGERQLSALGHGGGDLDGEPQHQPGVGLVDRDRGRRSTLASNQQATPTSGGTFIGVDVNAATVQSTGSGLVQLLGKGGDDGHEQLRRPRLGS